jgi:hypothetical protein
MTDLSKYLPELPFKPFRLLYRDTAMDPEIGQVVYDTCELRPGTSTILAISFRPSVNSATETSRS